MSRLAITGSSGMIGSHLKSLFKYKNIDFIDINRDIWDLSQWKSDKELDEIFKDVKAIFHFAAALPTNKDENQILFDVNVRSCLNIAQWATKNNIHIVYLSGSTVYQNTNAKSILEDAEKVVFGLGGFYGYTKLLAENVFSHFIPQGLNITILRPTSVYGLGLGEDKIINKFINKAKSNDIIDVLQANNKINFIHAMDVSYAALQAYSTSSYGIFNIAGEKITSISDLVNTIINVVGSGILGRNVNIDDSFERFDLNCMLARQTFDFNPRISITSGIEAMTNSLMLESIYNQ